MEKAAGIRFPRFITRIGLVAAIFLLFHTGCTTHPPLQQRPGRTNSDDITEINLVALPVTVNVASATRPDGFAVKIYPGNPNQPKAIRIPSGTLEVLMFDGVFGPHTPPNPKPLRTWSFPASELVQYETMSIVGNGYEMTLSWGANVPKEKRITVLARYLPRQGAPITSAATPITITGR